MEEGARRLTRHGIEALLSQLLPYKLVQRREVKVSKDTAYRIFHGRVEDVLRAVASLAGDPNWGGYSEGRTAMVQAAFDVPSDEQNLPRARLTAALEANINAQFESRAQPLGWLLQSAALTGSERWLHDDLRSSRGDLAEAILAARREFYEYMTAEMIGFLRLAMSELRLRPRPGWDAETIVVLIHCLIDGAVLRMFLEPERLTAKQVAEAAFELGTALGELGTYDDPRRPSDAALGRVFDDVVIEAARGWAREQAVSLDGVASRCGTSTELVRMIFPSVDELADSVLRHRVASGGFEHAVGLTQVVTPSVVRAQLGYLRDTLLHLADFAADSPEALALARAYHRRRSDSQLPRQLVPSFFETLTMAYVDVLSYVTPDPAGQLNDLVEHAALGEPGRSAVDLAIGILDRLAAAI